MCTWSRLAFYQPVPNLQQASLAPIDSPLLMIWSPVQATLQTFIKPCSVQVANLTSASLLCVVMMHCPLLMVIPWPSTRRPKWWKCKVLLYGVSHENRLMQSCITRIIVKLTLLLLVKVVAYMEVSVRSSCALCVYGNGILCLAWWLPVTCVRSMLSGSEQVLYLIMFNVG